MRYSSRRVSPVPFCHHCVNCLNSPDECRSAGVFSSTQNLPLPPCPVCTACCECQSRQALQPIRRPFPVTAMTTELDTISNTTSSSSPRAILSCIHRASRNVDDQQPPLFTAITCRLHHSLSSATTTTPATLCFPIDGRSPSYIRFLLPAVALS